MKHVLFDLNFDHGPVFLFSLIPVFINIGMFAYITLFLPDDKTNRAFAIFVLLLGIWQGTDSMMRLSATPETALAWFRISSASLVFMMPFGLLFALRFTKWSEKMSEMRLLAMLFFPAILFEFLVIGQQDTYTVEKDALWNWVADPEATLFMIIMYGWVYLTSVVMLVLLWRFYFKAKKDSVIKSQAFLLAAGFALPLLGGVLEEVVFPLLLHINEVPITAPLMGLFSLAALVAIKKYGLMYSPKHQWGDIMDIISEGILIVDKQNKIKYANKAFCEKLEYGFDELEGKYTHELFKIAEDAHKRPAIMDGNNMNSDSSGIQLTTKSGREIWMIISVAPYINAEGKEIGTIGVHTDISQIKEKENDLLQKEIKLKQAQEIAKTGSWELDFTSGIAVWSDEACRIYGLAPEENQHTFDAWLSFVHPDDLPDVMDAIAESKETMRPNSFYHRIIRKDGVVRFMHSQSKFEFNKKGVLQGLYGIASDITERVMAEQEREFEKSNLSALINNTNDLMWSVDREYKLIMSNTRFDKCIKQMTGKRIRKGGSVLAEGFSGVQLDRFKVFYDRAFAGEIFKETEYIASPAEVWSEISFYPMRNGEKIIGVACHSRDVSDIKRNEEKLTSTNKDLETFIYRASHDLRSPLCSIMGLVEVSSMEIQDKTAQQYLKMIGDATKKLDNILLGFVRVISVKDAKASYEEININRLIDDTLKKLDNILLGFVRVISVKDAKASYEEININRLIDDTLKKLENNTGYSRMNITKMGTLQSSFVSNRVVIESIFQNIMENAIKYQSPSLEKSILNILVWEKEKEVCFAFVDNGIGFDSSYLEKVFEMYFRASQEQQGSGLGLYLVNIGVKKLGGKIDVWSEKGKGAKFIVSLPLN